MARPKAKAPARRYHMSGQSVVTIAGRDIYLGKHDSAESIARYGALIALYQQNGLTLPDGFEIESLDERVAILIGAAPMLATHQADSPILVRHVTALFRDHVKEKYAGKQQETDRNNRLCDQLDEYYADIPAEQLGPVRLKEFRGKLVYQRLSRKYVNRLVRCVIAIFKHSVAGELIDVWIVERLKTRACTQPKGVQTR